VHVEDPADKTQAVPNRLKQTGDPAAASSDALVDSAVTIHPIHIDYDVEW